MAVVALAFLTAAGGFLAGPGSAATDDQNLSGLVYLADGTPLSATPWADDTGFAVWVNRGGDWSAAWRYPAAGWYLASSGAYSVVLPAAEKDVSWGNGNPYRMEFDVSGITDTPGRTDNATSRGTGDPGEVSPYGATENAIVWSETDNWQRWDVVLLALPDLAILPGDVAATPPTVQVGQAVSLSATVRNLGDRPADALAALFFDGNANRFPDPGEVLDQPPLSLDPGETADFVRTWTATGAGTFAFCAYADPEDAVPESDEGNNVDCATVVVQPPPETQPDYVPVFPQPSTSVRAGLSASVVFSVQVRNDGNATAPGTATLAFFNESTPASPFATFPVAPLAPSEASVRFAATWTSPAAPGTVRVVADVDHGDDLVEWDETNNRFAWTVDVVAGPVTSLVVGTPNVTAAYTSVTSATPFSFSVLDQSGTGIRNTTYRVDGGPWVNYTATGPFALAGEGPRLVEWFSEDRAGNVEATANATLVVDDTPPVTALLVGDPRHVEAETFVSSSTPLSLAAADGGVSPVGVASAEYGIDGGPWTPYAAPFSLVGEGTHTVRFRATDLLGNEEPARVVTLVVDDSPPDIAVEVGTPRYEGASTYVSSATPFTIAAADGGALPVGLAAVEVRVGGAWMLYTSPITLSGPDGPKTVEVRATDLLGNAATGSRAVILDDTPPTTTPSHADGTYAAGTAFAFPATDEGSGLARTEVRIDGGAWTPYGAPLVLGEGDHTIAFRSIDNLNNAEAERTLSVAIAGEPAIPPGTNWKPLVAAAFAAILALVGAWSARRAPWPTGSRLTLRAFTVTALPFVLAEGATGVLSLLTGLLSIPPLLGVGTAVDVGILLAGIAISAYRVRRWTPPK